MNEIYKETESVEQEYFGLLQNIQQNFFSLVEQEFQKKNGNTWPACVTTQLVLPKVILQTLHEQGDMVDLEYLALKGELETLITDVGEMNNFFKEQDVPDEEVKQEVFQRLSSIIDKILEVLSKKL